MALTATSNDIPSRLYADLAVADDRLNSLARMGPLTWFSDIEAYLVTRYDDVVAALKNRHLVTANATAAFDRLPEDDQIALAPARQSIDLWMGGVDDAAHRRLQGLLKQYFTPTTVNALRPRIRALSYELIDGISSPMDLRQSLAFLLPANVIGEMFGMPSSDYPKLLRWSEAITRFLELGEPAGMRVAQPILLEALDYVRHLLRDRRANPRSDMISMFAAAEREGKVTEDEILGNSVAILIAGHETTANMIAHGVELLLTHPDQLDLLRARPDLTPSAVEEICRFTGPVAIVSRKSREPVTIAGHEFGAGESFLLSLYGANRDPAVFPEPHSFDITRQNNRHVAFALGGYYCLGAALARAEIDEFFRIIFHRLPNLRLDSVRPAKRGTFMLLGPRIESLPVEF